MEEKWSLHALMALNMLAGVQHVILNQKKVKEVIVDLVKQIVKNKGQLSIQIALIGDGVIVIVLLEAEKTIFYRHDYN